MNHRQALSLILRGRTVSLLHMLRLDSLLRSAILATGLAAVGAAAALAQTASGEPVTIGVSGPLTGPNAQYGAQWKKGFDLALDEINAKGGVKGRPLQYVFEDSQADPRQTVAIAQKFVSDPKIVVEVGDFSSTASMAASSIYQRAGLVQFGFTNSHPNFTKGGDFIWSNSVSQADEQPRLAKYAADLGFKKVAVLYLNTDWGRASQKIFSRGGQGLRSRCRRLGRLSARREGLPLDAGAGARRQAGRDRAHLLLRRRRPHHPADPDGRPDDADRRFGIDLLAEVHRACRRRRQRRLHRNEFLPRREPSRGPDLRHEISSQVQRGAGRFQRRRL